MSLMLCTGTTFVKKNSCLVARVVPFVTAGLHLLTFCILEPYPSKDVERCYFFSGMFSHINGIIIVQPKQIINAFKFPSC